MNRRTSVLVACLIVVVVATALWVGLSGGVTSDQCKAATPKAYTVTIRGGKVSDADVQAEQCDTLTITNEDGLTRAIAFGVHDKHTTYDGVTERVIGHGKSLTVTLNQTGRFHWHDHLHDEVEGYFTVAK